MNAFMLTFIPAVYSGQRATHAIFIEKILRNSIQNGVSGKRFTSQREPRVDHSDAEYN